MIGKIERISWNVKCDGTEVNKAQVCEWVRCNENLVDRSIECLFTKNYTIK